MLLANLSSIKSRLLFEPVNTLCRISRPSSISSIVTTRGGRKRSVWTPAVDIYRPLPPEPGKPRQAFVCPKRANRRLRRPSSRVPVFPEWEASRPRSWRGYSRPFPRPSKGSPACQFSHHSKRRRAKGISAEGRLVVAGDENIRRRAFGEAGSHRNPRRYPLARVTTSGSRPSCSQARKVPVRPTPVCTSSIMTRAPAFFAAAQAARAHSRSTRFTPPSPCTTSMKKAHTVPSKAVSGRKNRSRRYAGSPRDGQRLAHGIFLPGRCEVASVLPWKDFAG